MDVEELILLVKDHEAIYDASRCEYRNRVFDDDDFHNNKNITTNNSNNVLILDFKLSPCSVC